MQQMETENSYIQGQIINSCSYIISRRCRCLKDRTECLPDFAQEECYGTIWGLCMQFITKYMQLYPQKLIFGRFGDIFRNDLKISYTISQYYVLIEKNNPDLGDLFYDIFLYIHLFGRNLEMRTYWHSD